MTDGLSEIALCESDEFSSRMCERGTKGCTVVHAQILDACCGGRHWWWDKAHPLAAYMDVRVVPAGNEWRESWSCEPDVVGDFRSMPFADHSFRMVVFDPPHIVRRNLETKWSTRFYGSLNPDTWQDDLRRGFAECWRVLAGGGALVFKWSGSLRSVESFFPADPVVGTRGTGDMTRWFIFYKPLESSAGGAVSEPAVASRSFGLGADAQESGHTDQAPLLTPSAPRADDGVAA